MNDPSLRNGSVYKFLSLKSDFGVFKINLWFKSNRGAFKNVPTQYVNVPSPKSD